MCALWIFYSRLRTEEKLLKKAADEAGLDCRFVDVRKISWPSSTAFSSGDVAICRCVSHNHNLALARLLESQGVRTVNHSSVIELCGDKISTAALLDKAGIRQPAYGVAFSPDQAVKLSSDMGYPVVFKPPVGSWGRLISKVNDVDSAETLVEHKSFMGSQHQTFFLQSYVEKEGYDVRALIVGGKVISAIKRCSDHWITNTARGASSVGLDIDPAMEEILLHVQKAFKGDILAVDLFSDGDGWMVNEVNGQAEFHGSLEGSGVDVPALIVEYVAGLMKEEI